MRNRCGEVVEQLVLFEELALLYVNEGEFSLSFNP